VSDEFDAAGAAAKAMGDTSDAAADAAGDATDAAVDVVDDAAGEGASKAPDTRSVLQSLLFAPERGPTQHTFVAHGVSPEPALALDGVVDWVLDVAPTDAGDELGDSLGPLGKITMGVGAMVSGAGDEETDDGPVDDAGGDDGGDRGPVVA
jgi:hypothetical protein